jgi:hypothetical protein
MNTYSETHPHEPEEEPVVDQSGRCLVCTRDVFDDERRQMITICEEAGIGADEESLPSQWGHDPVRRVQVLAGERRVYLVERNRYLAALTALDNMRPGDFKSGQGHLVPAFREVSIVDVMRFVCRIVNGVLHGTDEHGNPLIPESSHD